MAGYNGFSMSNNAVIAYESGEKPLSKWRKTDIICAVQKAIKEEELTLNCSMDKLKKVPVKALKRMCLSYSSWHHTSNHYNRTDFYSLDIIGIEKITDEEIEKVIADCKSEKKTEPKEEKWKCTFLEWGRYKKASTGNRNYRNRNCKR